MLWRSKRRARDGSPSAKGEEAPAPRASRTVSASFWRRPQGRRVLQSGVGILAVAALFLAIRPPASSFIPVIPEGALSPKLITATFEFEYVDLDATGQARDLAAAMVPPVFEPHPEVITDAVAGLHTLRNELLSDHGDDVPGILTALDIDVADTPHQYGEQESDSADIPLSIYESLAFYSRNTGFWVELEKAMQAIGQRGLVSDIKLVTGPQDEARRLRGMPNYLLGYRIGDAPRKTNVAEILDFQSMVSVAATHLEVFTGQEGLARRELGVELIRALLDEPTLVYDEETTATMRQIERDKTPVVKGYVQRYDTIVGQRQQVDRETVLKLEAMRERFRLSWLAEIGFLILAIVPLAGALGYMRRYHSSVYQSPRQLGVLVGLLILMVALGRAAAYISRQNPDLEQIALALPMGALALLISILVSGRLAAIFVATASLFLGLVCGSGMGFFALNCAMLSFWTGIVAILVVQRVKRRADFYRAGLAIALVAALYVLAYRVTQAEVDLSKALYWRELRWSLAWAAVNGAMSSILAIALLPILEDMLGVITDIKLLELSRRTPLLQRLEREAPGSYQHTMAVATLAESAADAIGADSLLTRVGSYYHDVGKMLKPEYFVENQETAADRARHAKLKPQMSVLVIRNHVKHGLELAREYGLPKVISDFIPEHHGTSLLKYFFHRILKEEPEGQVREEDFRYPGPKPQRKETAIVMLADGLEAAARVLDDKSEGGIRQFVRGMIRDKLEDRQFDECDLTLADLRNIEDAFCDVLHHMMHQRITYPSRPAPSSRVELGENDERNGERADSRAATRVTE